MSCSLILLGLFAGFLSHVSAGDVQVYFIDAPQDAFLQKPSDGIRLTAGGVKATVASLLAVDPPTGSCHQEVCTRDLRNCTLGILVDKT
jgi:hypothetical protein